MLFRIGWFFGYVDIWKGKKPHEKRILKLRFVVHVIDWEGRDDCNKRSDYRVIVER
jgi:hypothetical protein